MEQPKSSLTTVLEQPSQLRSCFLKFKKRNPVPTNNCKSEKLPEDLTVKSEKDKSFEGGGATALASCVTTVPGDINALPELKHYDLKQPAQPPRPPTPEAAKPEAPPLHRGPEMAVVSQSATFKEPLVSSESILCFEQHNKKCRRALKITPFIEPTTGCSEKSGLKRCKRDRSQCSLLNHVFPGTRQSQHPYQSDGQPQAADKIEQDSTGTAQALWRELAPPSYQGARPSMDFRRSSASSPSPWTLLSSSRSAQGYCIARQKGHRKSRWSRTSWSFTTKAAGWVIGRPTITSVYQTVFILSRKNPWTCLVQKKEPQKDSCVTDSEPVVNVIPPSANPINIAIPTVTAQLPTIVAIADQNSVPCFTSTGCQQADHPDPPGRLHILGCNSARRSKKHP